MRSWAANGGAALTAQRGVIRKGPDRISKSAGTIPSFRFPGTTPTLMRNGPASVCRPKPNGNCRSSGLVQKPFPWGDELEPGGKHMMNVWQGVFPTHNTEADGHYGPAPAKSFKPNRFGLYNMTGNVWEWCSDWFDPDYYRTSPRINPEGPAAGQKSHARRLLSLPRFVLQPLPHRCALLQYAR